MTMITPKRPHDVQESLKLDKEHRPEIKDLIDLSQEARISVFLIQALQSGKYAQGTGSLRNGREAEQPQHCCLGVLCEILPFGYFDEENTFRVDDVKAPDIDEEELWEQIQDDFAGAGYPPWQIIASLPENQRRPAQESMKELARLNDGNIPFDVVARVIDFYGLYRVPSGIAEMMIAAHNEGRTEGRRIAEAKNG